MEKLSNLYETIESSEPENEKHFAKESGRTLAIRVRSTNQKRKYLNDQFIIWLIWIYAIKNYVNIWN